MQSITLFLEEMNMARLLKKEDEISKWAEKELKEAEKKDKKSKTKKRR